MVTLRCERRRHQIAIDSVPKSLTIMDIDDLDHSSNATCYEETEKKKADAKKEPALINCNEEVGETSRHL